MVKYYEGRRAGDLPAGKAGQKSGNISTLPLFYSYTLIYERTF